MLITVIGGAACGKSALAEDIAQNLGGRKLYIATMKPYGFEGVERVKRHKKLRAGKGFITIEKYCRLKEILLSEHDTILLECLSNLVANEFFDGESDYFKNIIEGLDHLKSKAANAVVVTNDIFSDGMNYSDEVVEYAKLLGKVNIYLAGLSDTVIEVVAGIPIIIKGGCGYEKRI